MRMALAVVGVAGVAAGIASAQPIAAPTGTQDVIAFWGDYITNPAGNNYWRGDRRYRNSGGQFSQLTDLDGDGSADDRSVFYTFSTNTELNPRQFDRNQPEFEYRVNDFGARFYGGMNVEYANNSRTLIHQAFVQPEGANPNDVNGQGRWGRAGGPAPEWKRAGYTEITLFPYHPPEHQPGQLARFHASFLWKKNDFAEFARTTGFRMDDTATLAFTFGRKFQNIQEARFVIQDADGTFYVSESWAHLSPQQINLYGADFTVGVNELLWAEWTTAVEGASNFRFDASSAVFSEHRFSDALTVGLYFGSGWSQAETKLAFDQFRFFATPIPAPSVAALAGVGLAVASRRRR